MKYTSLIICIALLTISACAKNNTDVIRAQQIPQQEISTSSYILGTGDNVRVTVFNEPDLSGEFDVNGTGAVSLPLIGDMQAAGKTLKSLEYAITKRYKKGFLLDPKVNVEVLSFRPFFIMGEVNNPGSYPYINSLSIINAVALAGGYTYRAKKDPAYINRDGQEIKAQGNFKILPGDTIEIKERFF